MPLTVVADPLDPLCNSYVTVEEVSEYAATRVADDQVSLDWDSLDEAKQNSYVVNASRSLDTNFTWIGERYSRDQRLNWPRYNALVDGYWLDVTTFPARVKEAAAEMALWLMSNSGATAVGQNAQYDSIRVGPLSINFNEGVGGAALKYVPDQVTILLRDYGSLGAPNLPSANQLKVVRIQRA